MKSTLTILEEIAKTAIASHGTLRAASIATGYSESVISSALARISKKAAAAPAGQNSGKVDTSIAGWFRALKPVDGQFQSWECVGWFRTMGAAREALGLVG